jgi:hypothetical protein
MSASLRSKFSGLALTKSLAKGLLISSPSRRGPDNTPQHHPTHLSDTSATPFVSICLLDMAPSTTQHSSPPQETTTVPKRSLRRRGSNAGAATSSAPSDGPVVASDHDGDPRGDVDEGHAHDPRGGAGKFPSPPQRDHEKKSRPWARCDQQAAAGLWGFTIAALAALAAIDVLDGWMLMRASERS